MALVRALVCRRDDRRADGASLGYALFGAAGAIQLYVNVFLAFFERAYVLPAVGPPAYYTYVWGDFVCWGRGSVGLCRAATGWRDVLIVGFLFHWVGQLVSLLDWELDNFDLLVDQMRAFCEHAEREFARALLRPHGPALQPILEQGAPVDDVLRAAQEAGRQLMNEGAMSPESLDIVSRE